MKAVESYHPLMDAGGKTVTKNEEKTTFFASGFHSKTGCCLSTQSPELENRDVEKNEMQGERLV